MQRKLASIVVAACAVAGLSACALDLEEPEEIGSSAHALSCSPSWALDAPGTEVCYLDEDGWYPIYYRVEHYVADRYYDTSGCMSGPAYRLREIDEVRCYNVPLERCVHPDHVALGRNRDLCNRPRVEDLSGSISASPSTVPIADGQSVGPTRICWDTPVSRPAAKIYVSHNGAPETLFASGRSGCQDAPWIQRGHSYRFTLYSGYGTAYPLDDVLVRGVSGDTGGSCPPGQSPRCGLPCYPDNQACY